MSRGLSAGVISALSSNTVRPIIFAELHFSSGVVYTHDGIGTYTWGSQDWIGIGSFGTISNIQEGSEVSPYSITLMLSGLDSTMSSAALTEDYFMREVTLYLGMLDEDDVLIDTPTQLWTGFMDVMTVNIGDSGGDTIELVCESELAKFDRSSNLRYTHVQQQKVNSSDLFFEFLKDIEGAKIRWKSANSENLTGGGSDDTLIKIPSITF